jgi:hypothetical protein
VLRPTLDQLVKVRILLRRLPGNSILRGFSLFRFPSTSINPRRPPPRYGSDHAQPANIRDLLGRIGPLHTVIGPVESRLLHRTGLVLVAVSRRSRPNTPEFRCVGGTDGGIELLAAGDAFIITEGRTRPVVVGADAFDSFLRLSEYRAKSLLI